MAITAAKVRGLALKAIQSMGGILEPIVYSKLTVGPYDTATGVQSNTTVDLPMTVPVLTLDEDERKDFPAPDKVRRVIIPYAYLQAKGYEPAPGDYMTLGGLQYELKRFKVVPTQAITKFWIESP